MSYALHVIKAVECRAGTAHADQLARFQYAAVAGNIQAAFAGDRFGGSTHVQRTVYVIHLAHD